MCANLLFFLDAFSNGIFFSYLDETFYYFEFFNQRFLFGNLNEIEISRSYFSIL